MSFFDNNINSFVVGSEEGELYLADRHGNKGEVQRSIVGGQKQFFLNPKYLNPKN